MSILQFMRDWTAHVRDDDPPRGLLKMDLESRPGQANTMPECGLDVMSEVQSKLVADWVARHGLVKNAQLVFQKISSYTLTKKGTVCFWDEDGKPVTCTVKSRNTSRRNLHKRARRHIGRSFVSMAVQPHKPLEVVNVSMDVSFTFDNKPEMKEAK